MTKDTLKARQEAGERVEQKMLAALMQYAPVTDLTVSSVKTIAYMARSIAFDEFSALEEAK